MKYDIIILFNEIIDYDQLRVEPAAFKKNIAIWIIDKICDTLIKTMVTKWSDVEHSLIRSERKDKRHEDTASVFLMRKIFQTKLYSDLIKRIIDSKIQHLYVSI